MIRGRAAAALVLLLGLAACSPDPAQLSISGETMGTGYAVRVADPGRLAGVDAAALIDRELDAVNGMMSTWDPRSALMQFNAAASTDWIGVPASLAEVAAEAQRISELSDGAFDVTAGPLVDAWGFGPPGGGSTPPSPATLAAARERVGFRLLEVRASPPALRKRHPGLQMDLSAIAKGYAADRIAAALGAAGSRHFLVEIGGELRIRGRRPGGEPWRVGIEQPDPGRRQVRRLLALPRDAGIATSGDYRNYFEAGGQRYAHIIDPRSGRPATHALASVTVLAADCARADGLATALAVLGPDDGYRLAERHGIAALFVARDGDGFAERATPAFDAWLAGPAAAEEPSR